MFDKYITIEKEKELIPYCREVKIKTPTTQDDIKKLREQTQQLKEELLSLHVAELKPLGCEVLISRWENIGQFGNEILLQIKTNRNTNYLKYLTVFEIDSQEFLIELEGKIRELIAYTIRIPFLESYESFRFKHRKR